MSRRFEDVEQSPVRQWSDLTPEQQTVLEESMAAADRGDFVDGEALLNELDRLDENDLE